MPFPISHWYFYHKPLASIFLLASWGVYCLEEGIFLEEKPGSSWIDNILKERTLDQEVEPCSTPGPALNLGNFVPLSGS